MKLRMDMKPDVEVPLEVQEDRRSGNSDASDQECVSERRRLGVEEGRQGTEDSGPAGDLHGSIQEGQKAGGESDASVKMEPPDGGWGWVVAFASAVIMSIYPVMNQSFGLLFSRYFLLEGVSSTTTAWIFNTQTFLFYTTGIFVRPLSLEFGWRKIAVTGALLASLGFTITAFAPAPEFLFFSLSILCGIGAGMVVTLCFTVVPCYFTRRRGVAHAIMGCGMGAGQIGMPPLLMFLQGIFSDRGTTLIFSGIILQSCIAATTFHPVERHMKPSTAKFTKKVDPENQETMPQHKPQTTNSTSSTKPSILVRVAKSAMSDLGILRSRRACIVTVAWALVLCSNLNFLMMVPFALQDVGLSLEFSAWCLSSLSVSFLIFRILSSALTDLKFFKVRVFFVAGLVITAATNAVIPLMGSKTWLIALLVGYGAGMGIVGSLNTLVMIDVMGIDRLAPLFGATCLICSFTFITLGPIIGVIRDASGSYAVSIWCTAALAGCSVLLYALMGPATRWDAARREEGRPNL